MYEEHFKDRLNVYNSINDQKRKYAEKASSAFHKVLRESRAKQDDLKSKIRSIGAEIQMEQNAIRRLHKILVKFKQIEKENQKKIKKEINQISDNIEIANNKAKSIINSAYDEAAENINQTTEKYANLEREDQKKRDKIQDQQLKYAKNSNAILNVWASENGWNKGWNKGRGILGIGKSTVKKEEKKREL